jgi:prophage maintenance system killer protein
MAGMQYLTVQDLLWVHLQVTKQVEPFDLARLEDAVYAQYGYGKSTDIFAQAGRFAQELVKKAAFAAGNQSMAFLASLAFLEMNGVHLDVHDAEGVRFFDQVLEGEAPGDTFRSRVQPGHGDHHDEDYSHGVVEPIVLDLVNRFGATIESLKGRTQTAV